MVDPFEVHNIYLNKDTDPKFKSIDYKSSMIDIFRTIKDAIFENKNNTIVHMDVDICFFAPCIPTFLNYMNDFEALFMAEDSYEKKINGGLIVIKCNEITYNLFHELETITREFNDPRSVGLLQGICQEMMDNKKLNYSILPRKKFCSKANGALITKDALLYHAAGVAYDEKEFAIEEAKKLYYYDLSASRWF